MRLQQGSCQGIVEAVFFDDRMVQILLSVTL